MLNKPNGINQAKDWIKKQSLNNNPLQILRRELPALGNLFEDDNSLIYYLSNRNNRKTVFNQLTLSPEQRVELEQTTRPEEIVEQSGNVPTEIPVTSQEAPAEQTIPPTGGPPPFIPSVGSPIQRVQGPRRVFVMPKETQEKTETAETMEDKPQAEQPPQEKLQEKPPAVQAAIKEQPLRFQSGWRSTLKTGLSNAGIWSRQNGGRILNGLRGMVGSVLGGTARGGGTLIARGLNSGIPGGGAISGGMGRIRGAAGSAGSSLKKIGKSRLKWVILAMLVSGGIFGVITASNPTGQPVSTAPITGAGGDISSCKFIRSDQKPQEAGYNSPLLLSYFQEASAKSDIPATVLAAFTRVESPSISNMTDDQVKNYAAHCAISETGALGIMQIQPPGTTSLQGDLASCDDCIDAGARLVGKTVQTMTKDDYCDPRTSIIVGSGWILKKMDHLGYKNTGQWNPSWTNDEKAITVLVNTYYGCLQYGGSKSCTGPFNYKDDVWDSLQNCQQSTATLPIASCPVSNGIISTPSYQAGRASGANNGHCDGGYGYTCHCGTEGRRAKAIDVPTNGKHVQLPTINNERVNWTLILDPYKVDSEEGGGYGYTFLASQGGDSYYLDMLHLNTSSMYKGVGYPSGDPVATTAIGHVHMTIGKNLKTSPVAGSATDCDPGWLPSDFMCK